jgi:hypothetical protein
MLLVLTYEACVCNSAMPKNHIKQGSTTGCAALAHFHYGASCWALSIKLPENRQSHAKPFCTKLAPIPCKAFLHKTCAFQDSSLQPAVPYCHTCPVSLALMRKYVDNSMGLFTPLGTNTKDPSEKTALLRAA